MASKTTTAVVAYFVENSAAGDGSRATSSGSFGNSSSTVPRRSAIMISAAKSMKRRKLPPRWIDASKVQQTCEQLFSTRSPAHITTTTISNAADEEEDENDHSTATTPLSKDEVMFVLDTFDGSAVYEYLSKAGARVISPYVIKYCDEECPEPFATIPMRPHALFSQCMRGLVVTATSLPTQTRKALQARVMMMGGAYSSGLNSAVTLLVAGSVTTDKYRAAYRMKIPVMSAEWVERCWTTYQYDLVRADSPELLRRHALPVFHNLMITCSGVDITDRQAVRRQIEKHGGSYSPTLRFDALNTVLVLSAPAGEKYIYAKKKNIPRLRFKWVADSMSAGYALPFDDYNIDAGDVSVMAVDETVVVSTDRGGSGCNSSTNSSAASTATGTTQRLRSNLNNLRDLADLLDELTLAVTSSTAEQDNSNAAAANSASFLDQAVIFAVGFDEHSTVAIRNAVRRCGALFVAEFKPRLVTHVIAGPAFSSGQPLYGRLLEANVEKVVTIDWLIAALKAAECVDYLQYRFQPTQSSSSATTTQRSGSSSRSTNGTASTAERNGKRNKPDFLFSTQAEKLIQDFEDGQEQGQGLQPQFNSTAATTPNCTASSSMANFRTLISTTPASVTVAKTVRTIEEVVAKKQAEVIDIIDDEEEEEAEKTGETVEEESSPELVEEIEVVKRKKKTTTTTTTAATKSAASKAKGRKASATASVSSASSTTSSRTSKRSKASVVSSVLGTGKAPASNFRPLTGAFESDEDGPVKWSPTTAAKMRAEALAAAKGGGRQQPTPSKLAQVRTSSKRLQKKLNEDEVEGIKEEEESLSPINRSSRKRTVRAISDDEEEEEEEEENEEEVHDSGAGLSNQPTLNLNNQRSATTTTTSNSNNLPTYSTYSAGVMSTYPDEEETSMEDDEEQQDEEEEGDEEQEEEDSIDDYIGDSIEDEEEEEEELGELTQPLGHSTIIERTSAAEEEVVEAPKSSAKPPSQRPPLLMLSGFTDDVRERLATDLEAKLGVAVHRSPTVLHPVTHLILREPYATEKTLSAIAAGVWLLVPAYVERSLEAGRLLPEADFDWSAQDLSSYSNSSSRRRLMLASAVWRRYITDRNTDGNGGVFSGWRTLLVTRSACMDSMAKILEAGRAEVLWLEEQFKGASGASGKRVSSQAFERTLGELLATVRYAIFDRAVMTGEEGRSALATASAASTQRPTGTAATAPTTQAYPKELLSRLQFSRLLEAFAGRGRLLPQEALSRYLISAKPAEDEDGGDGGGGDVLGRCAVSPSQLKEVLKGLK